MIILSEMAQKMHKQYYSSPYDVVCALTTRYA